jgi:hypothetical protein
MYGNDFCKKDDEIMEEIFYNYLYFKNKDFCYIQKQEKLPCYSTDFDSRQKKMKISQNQELIIYPKNKQYICDSQIIKNKNEKKSIKKSLHNSKIYESHQKIYEFENEKNKATTILKFIFTFLIWTILILIPIIFLRDVLKKTRTAIDGEGLKKELCYKEYIINKCDNPVPMTELFCLEKEKCFQNKNNHVLILKSFFSVVFDVLDECVSLISLKTLLLFLVIFSCFFLVSFCNTNGRKKIKYN